MIRIMMANDNANDNVNNNANNIVTLSMIIRVIPMLLLIMIITLLIYVYMVGLLSWQFTILANYCLKRIQRTGILQCMWSIPV